MKKKTIIKAAGTLAVCAVAAFNATAADTLAAWTFETG